MRFFVFISALIVLTGTLHAQVPVPPLPPTGPPILLEQVAEFRGWVKSVVVQDVLAQPGNVVETESSVKEAFDGDFVCRVEHRTGGATSSSNLEAKTQGGEGVEVRRFEVEREGDAEVE